MSHLYFNIQYTFYFICFILHRNQSINYLNHYSVQRKSVNFDHQLTKDYYIFDIPYKMENILYL